MWPAPRMFAAGKVGCNLSMRDARLCAKGKSVLGGVNLSTSCRKDPSYPNKIDNFVKLSRKQNILNINFTQQS